MENYMLILFSYGGLEKINKHLKRKIDRGDKLLVRAVMLAGVPKLIDHLISDEGILGEKVVSDLEESVVDIYRDNAENYLEELKDLAAERNFELDQKLLKYSELETIKDEIEAAEVDRIFINFSHNEYVSNQVKEKEIKSWLEKIELPQDIFYDGENK